MKSLNNSNWRKESIKKLMKVQAVGSYLHNNLKELRWEGSNLKRNRSQSHTLIKINSGSKEMSQTKMSQIKCEEGNPSLEVKNCWGSITNWEYPKLWHLTDNDWFSQVEDWYRSIISFWNHIMLAGEWKYERCSVETTKKFKINRNKCDLCMNNWGNK